jgi:6-phosphogluconolactonase (cycloisomerase 2 family)
MSRFFSASARSGSKTKDYLSRVLPEYYGAVSSKFHSVAFCDNWSFMRSLLAVSTLSGLILALSMSGCGGGGASGGASSGGSNSPPPPPKEILYAAGYGQAVLEYNIDMGTGAPTLITSAAGSSSSGIAITPSNTFLYASNAKDPGVNAFSISSGGLTLLSGSPFLLPSYPAFNEVDSLAMDPAGKFLYTPDASSSQIIGFSISTSSGALTPLPGSPFPAGMPPLEVAIDPSGKFLYESGGGVSGFTIDSSTGALTLIPGSPFSTLGYGEVDGLAFHPSGKFLYAAAFSTNKIAAYSINTTTGVLTAVPGSVFSLSNSNAPLPYSLTVDPTGKFLYALGSADGKVYGFTIDANTGALTAINGSPFGIQWTLFLSDLVVDPSGKFLYAGGGGLNGMFIFSINATTGALTSVNDPLPAGMALPHLGFVFAHSQ